MKQITKEGEVRDYVRQEDEDSTGTSLQGYIEFCTYGRLVEVFGEPNGFGDGYKVQVEWDVMTPDGIATIYDWKMSENYLGQGQGVPIGRITEWHIGGHNKDVVEHVKKALKHEAR